MGFVFIQQVSSYGLEVEMAVLWELVGRGEPGCASGSPRGVKALVSQGF